MAVCEDIKVSDSHWGLKWENPKGAKQRAQDLISEDLGVPLHIVHHTWGEWGQHALNRRKGPEIHILSAQGTINAVWGCQWQESSPLQFGSLFIEAWSCGSPQGFFWREDFYCWCKSEPEEWPLPYPWSLRCRCSSQDKISGQCSLLKHRLQLCSHISLKWEKPSW